MEIIQSVTQPQVLLSPMQGMAGQATAAGTQTAPVDPSLFAVLLQGILLPAAATAGCEIKDTENQAAVEQGAHPAKAKGDLASSAMADKTATGTDAEPSVQTGALMALMLAAAGQADRFQTRPNPERAVLSPGAVPVSAGQAAGEASPTVLPQPMAVAGQAQGVALPTLPEANPPKGVPVTSVPIGNAVQVAIAGRSPHTEVNSDPASSGGVMNRLAAGPTGAAEQPATQTAQAGHVALPSWNSAAFSAAFGASTNLVPAAVVAAENPADAAGPGNIPLQSPAVRASQIRTTADQPMFPGQLFPVAGGASPTVLPQPMAVAGQAQGVALPTLPEANPPKGAPATSVPIGNAIQLVIAGRSAHTEVNSDPASSREAVSILPAVPTFLTNPDRQQPGAENSATASAYSETISSGETISRLPAGPTGAAAQPATQTAQVGLVALPSWSSAAFSAAVGASTNLVPAVVAVAENRADATGTGEIPPQSAAVRASRVRTMADQPMFPGQLFPVTGESRPPVPQTADAVAGTPAGAAVEAVFASLFSKGESREKGENSESGAQKDGREEGLPGTGILALRSVDLPDSARVARLPNGDEARNALQESVLSQVREGVVRHDGKGNGQMTVRLNPQELGELRINVRVEAQQVKVEVISDNRTVREALVGNLDALKETLAKQNLSMEGFTVSTGSGNGFNQPFREQRGDRHDTSRIRSGRETGPTDLPLDKTGLIWGGTESSLVDLRL